MKKTNTEQKQYVFFYGKQSIISNFDFPSLLNRTCHACSKSTLPAFKKERKIDRKQAIIDIRYAYSDHTIYYGCRVPQYAFYGTLLNGTPFIISDMRLYSDKYNHKLYFTGKVASSVEHDCYTPRRKSWNYNYNSWKSCRLYVNNNLVARLISEYVTSDLYKDIVLWQDNSIPFDNGNAILKHKSGNATPFAYANVKREGCQHLIKTKN